MRWLVGVVLICLGMAVAMMTGDIFNHAINLRSVACFIAAICCTSVGVLTLTFR